MADNWQEHGRAFGENRVIIVLLVNVQVATVYLSFPLPSTL
ncbi:hypothetical protein [Sporosarcina sp. FSL W7-1283]